MTKYSLVPATNYSDWDSFSMQSPQRSVFFQSRYLSVVGRKYALFFVRQGEQIKAGVALVLSDDGGSCQLDSLVIYNGILFAAAETSRPAKARMERFELTEFIIKELNDRFNGVEMSLSPAFEDMRPFLWHNFHSSQAADKFRIDLRYTSFLDISEFFLLKADSETDLFRRLDNSRQADLRKAQGRLAFGETDEVERFVQFYDEILLSQGAAMDSKKLDRIRNLIVSILHEKLAKMFAVINENGQLTYMMLFTLFQNQGCYLFAAGDQNNRQRYDGTYCLWESLKALSRLGVREIDLEGVNSPQRGAFKLGFGGDLRPYFRVSMLPRYG